MPANTKSTYLPYVPGNPPTLTRPEEITRAVWDELFRLSQSLLDLDRPVSLSLSANDTLTVTTVTQTWARLFNNTPSILHQMPGGCLDPLTGIYTVSSQGVYQIYGRVNIPAFPSPQSKSYTGYIRISIVRAGGLGTTTFLLESGGLDDRPLTVQGLALYPLNKGDIIYFDGAVIRVAGGGTINVTDTLQIFRISGTE